ncbi:TRAP transporter small permease [Lacrimispora sp.]|uniref:TRAP transporter small permease n=1 Tax=Lacrimispora sp. TaxID=2719234 RepID=UPI00345FCDD5
MKVLIGRIEIILAGTAMGIAVIATFLNVICRYFFNHPIYQAEEIATSMFVWLVFIGASACFKEDMHVGIDCLVSLLPDRIRRWVGIFTDIVLILINIAMAYMAITITISARMKLTSALRVSYSFIDAAAAIGFICMAIHSVEFLIRDCKALTSTEDEKGGE